MINSSFCYSNSSSQACTLLNECNLTFHIKINVGDVHNFDSILVNDRADYFCRKVKILG